MKVVIGYDGSRHAEVAVSSLSILGPEPLEVTIVQVKPPAPHGLRQLFKSEQISEPYEPEISFDKVTDKIKAMRPESKIIHRVLEGHPSDCIINEARRVGASLIIMGRRGMGQAAQLFLGSVSLNVIHHSPVPVLIAQEEVKSPGTFLCAADGSDSSLRALRWVSQKNRLQQGAIFHVKTINEQGSYFSSHRSITTEELDQILTGYYENTSKQARLILEQTFPAGAVHSEIYTGTHPPATYLLESADEIKPDIILMRYRGLGAVSRFFTGSVTHTILGGSSWNVLIVPDS